MNAKYFKDSDSLEIMLESKIPTLGIETDNDEVTEFIHKTKKHIVGYYIERFSEIKEDILNTLELTIAQKIGLISVVARTNLGLSQEQVATSAGISRESYLRLEKGKNISIDIIEKVLRVFSQTDFSICLSSKQAS